MLNKLLSSIENNKKLFWLVVILICLFLGGFSFFTLHPPYTISDYDILAPVWAVQKKFGGPCGIGVPENDKCCWGLEMRKIIVMDPSIGAPAKDLKTVCKFSWELNWF